MKTDLYEISYMMKRDLHRRIFFVVSICLLFFAVITLFLRFILFPVCQKSVSMDPSIVPGSRLLVSPLVRTPDRGDIVLLKPIHKGRENIFIQILDAAAAFFTGQQVFPFSSPSKMSNSFLLRRVIGMPGDTLYMTDYIVYIKPSGESHYLTEFEYVSFPYEVNIISSPQSWDSSLGSKASMTKITLGANEYFVLGDNRNSCVDSRLWGPVSAFRIRGKVLLQYFPLKKISFFK